MSHANLLNPQAISKDVFQKRLKNIADKSFVCGRTSDIASVFVGLSCLGVPKIIRLN